MPRHLPLRPRSKSRKPQTAPQRSNKMCRFFQTFTKITAWPAQAVCFRTKIHYEDKRVQGRRIKGKAIIVSNHTSVYDFAVMLFTFPFRTLRYLMAEVLFRRKGLSRFLKKMGGIFVDRDAYDFAFLDECNEILRKGGVVGVFPEGRLPREGEERPLPFLPSTAYLALMSGAPIIPVYTNGSYFQRKRARVIIGKPVDVSSIARGELSEKENIEAVNEYLRQRIVELRNELQRQLEHKNKKKKA